MPTSDWAVDVAAVGAVLRARTKNNVGEEVGTFTADTRPTDVQVEDLLAGAVGDVAGEVGVDIHADLWPMARRVAATGAAMEVEISYYPEDVASGRSPYEQLSELYDRRMKSLKAAVQDLADGTSEVEGIGSPSYGFPAGDNMVGWGTQF